MRPSHGSHALNVLARVLREPLVWFLAIGALLFALARPEGEIDAGDARVVVSAGRVEQLAGIFAKTWMRPPTVEELRDLIREHVLEELKVRQALALGLDRDDTVIRRRLAQKWDFLSDTDADLLTPSGGELEGFLAAHAERFRVDPTFTFLQVFVSPERHGELADDVAHERLAALRAGEDVEGDSTLLPEALEAAPAHEVARTFGAGFVAALEPLPLGEWRLVRSSFGTHVVRLDARESGRLPDLADVRPAVVREWAAARRHVHEARREAALLAGVEVVVEWPEVSGVREFGAPESPQEPSE